MLDTLIIAVAMTVINVADRHYLSRKHTPERGVERPSLRERAETQKADPTASVERPSRKSITAEGL